MAEAAENIPVKKEEASGAVAPAEPLTSLRQEIDHLFDEFMSGWPFRRRRAGSLEPFRGLPSVFGTSAPAVDVIDKDKEMVVQAELPGLEEKDISVQLSDDMLTISGEKKEEREEGEKKGRYYLSERRYGAFQRSLRVPEGVSRDDITAKFRKGVLTVTLPKTPEAQLKSKKIEVKSGD